MGYHSPASDRGCKWLTDGVAVRGDVTDWFALPWAADGFCSGGLKPNRHSVQHVSLLPADTTTWETVR